VVTVFPHRRTPEILVPCHQLAVLKRANPRPNGVHERLINTRNGMAAQHVSPEPLACFRARGEQSPIPLRDDFEVAVDNLDRGLIVNHVGRHG
jgi:hypothetical protein